MTTLKNKLAALAIVLIATGWNVLAEVQTPNSAYRGDKIQPPKYMVPPRRRADVGNTGANILLIETGLPWDSTADTTVLDSLGKSYDVADWPDIQNGSINIFSYQVVLIVNDQVQQFYDDYAANVAQFEQYVESGGTLLFFAAAAGWNGGILNANLPGGVTWNEDYECCDQIVDPNHPIVTDVLSEGVPLQNSELCNNYCSHGYFSNLVSGTTVIIEDTNIQQPTLIEYTLGKGTVIASTLTWEFSYDHSQGTASPCAYYGDYAVHSLDDAFLYAFSIAGGYVSNQLEVNIYPEDMWQPTRPTLYKAQGDLIDVVGVILNNGTNVITGVALELDIADGLTDPGFLKVYRRKSADHIAIELPTELTPGVDYTDQTVAGARMITISNLTIPVQALMPQHTWNDFVFRFRLQNPLAKGTTVDAAATVSASGFTPSSASLSDGGDIRVLANGRVIVTSREPLYKQYARNGSSIDWNAVDQIHVLWQALYRIAANRAGVIEFADKEEYVADTDHSVTSDIIRNWPDHRQNLANGGANTSGNYHYSPSPTENDEPTINQAAIKVRQYLDDHIVRSGGIPSSGREVLILGGDNIIPFYRKWDSTDTTTDYAGHYNATSVTYTDALNNYLFSDMFYRATNSTSWVAGSVDEVYVGRIAGADVDSMNLLFNSTDSTAHNSANAVEVENKARDGSLDAYDLEVALDGYNLINSVRGVTLDLEWYDLLTRDDPARWPNQFSLLFTNQDFVIYRMIAHGSVQAVYPSSDNANDPYFTGADINSVEDAISANFSHYYPSFVFDNCLVGLVDGPSRSDMFNALFRVLTGGILGSSGVTVSDYCSDHNSLFTEPLLEGRPAGYSLNYANRTYAPFLDFFNYGPYTKLQMNYFGCPWFTVANPASQVNAPAGKQARTRREVGPRITAARILANQGTSDQVVSIDASNFQTTNVNGYAIVNVTGFNLSRVDGEPVVPAATYVIELPADAQNCTVTVTPSNVVSLGTLNIPAYVAPPPMQAPPPNYPPYGYTNCPPNLGVYPTPQESHVIATIGDKQVVRVQAFPLQYDTATKIATLAANLTLTVGYTTATKGVVSQFITAGEQYSPNQSLPTTTTIKNTSSDDPVFSITVQLTDLTGNVVAIQTTNQTIQSGASADIGVTLTTPATPGLYYLDMSASDGGAAGNVGSSMRFVQVNNGAISGFIVPDTFTPGQPGTLQVSFQNMSQSAVTAVVDIAILSLGGGQIAKLPQFMGLAPGLTTINLTTQWIPSSDVPNDFYYASAVVTAGGATIGPAVAYFTIGTCTINTSASPSDGGATIGGGTVNYGSNVTVNATANSGYTFVNWSEGGTVVSTNTAYTFVATTNRNLVANFSQPLTINSLKLQAKFKKAGSDTCAIKGTLTNLPTGFSVANAAAALDVGGTTLDFQLNKKGSAANHNGSIKFSYNKKTGIWTFTASVKGDLKESWATYGITSGTVISSDVTFPVLLTIQSGTLEIFAAELPLTYSNRSGTSGTGTYRPVK
jgi:hypothetical protein